MPRAYAYANPEVLRWARESTGYTIEEAAHKIGIRWPQLEMAEQGVEHLTLRQAERAAETYERPLAALLLPSPPQEPPPEAVFRRLPGAPELPWPAEMHLLARRIRRRQDAAAELYEDLEEPEQWSATRRQLRGMPPAALARFARRILRVSADEQMSWAQGDKYAPLRGWIDAVESLGVLVMQDGSMPLGVMRGFASVHDVVPAIVVNNADVPRARAFTVLHEFGHLIMDAAGVSPGPRAEQWANDFAGEVAIPRDWLEDELHAVRGLSLLKRVESIARRFGVTSLAAAVRVRRSGLAPKDEAEDVIRIIRGRGEPDEPEQQGGQYYRNTISKLGPTYIGLVFSALDSEVVSYPVASALLGDVKVNFFDTLREYLARRRADG